MKSWICAPETDRITVTDMAEHTVRAPDRDTVRVPVRAMAETMARETKITVRVMEIIHMEILITKDSIDSMEADTAEIPTAVAAVVQAICAVISGVRIRSVSAWEVISAHAFKQ